MGYTIGMNEDDLRVQRTRRLLRDAFIQLVIARGYEPVTVREITKKAQVGYKTFYRHYPSKEMLLRTILNELIHDFQLSLDKGEQQKTPQQKTMVALEFTKKNAELFLALIQSPQSEQLLEPLMKMAVQESSLHMSEGAVPHELAVYHFAASLDALIKWWLKHDMPYSTKEMATYINRLVILPAQQVRRLK